MPIRLSQYRTAVAKGLQRSCDDRCSEGRMVDVSITGNIYKINLFKALFKHFCTACR